jgi:Zn-dependent membrane protease YugP
LGIVIAGLLLLLFFAPTLWVKWAMKKHSQTKASMPGSGGELAKHLVKRFGLEGVSVERTEHGDHYDPETKTVRLTESNFSARSLTAVAIAAHEVGHAIQHQQGDPRISARTRLATLANKLARVSSAMIWAAPLVGLLLRHPVPLSVTFAIGLSGLITRMLLHLVTLPLEWDASFGKALPVLNEGKYVDESDQKAVKQILRAAAFTYVAAAFADVLNLWRWATLLIKR